MARSIAHSRPAGLTALAGVLLIGGCVSISGNDRETVRIVTDPPGAAVVNVNGERCTTPCELAVPKMKIQALWVEKEGFEPVEVPLRSRTWRTGIAASIGGNLALGLLVAVAGAAIAYTGETFEDAAGGLAIAVGGTVLGLGGGAAVDIRAGAHRKLTTNDVQLVLRPSADSLPETRDRDEAAPEPWSRRYAPVY